MSIIPYEKKLILIKPMKEHRRISVRANAKTFCLPDVQQKIFQQKIFEKSYQSWGLKNIIYQPINLYNFSLVGAIV